MAASLYYQGMLVPVIGILRSPSVCQDLNSCEAVLAYRRNWSRSLTLTL
jgi:hypothetical protein